MLFKNNLMPKSLLFNEWGNVKTISLPKTTRQVFQLIDFIVWSVANFLYYLEKQGQLLDLNC